jgi:hypothetical protein
MRLLLALLTALSPLPASAAGKTIEAPAAFSPVLGMAAPVSLQANPLLTLDAANPPLSVMPEMTATTLLAAGVPAIQKAAAADQTAETSAAVRTLFAEGTAKAAPAQAVVAAAAISAAPSLARPTAAARRNPRVPAARRRDPQSGKIQPELLVFLAALAVLSRTSLSPTVVLVASIALSVGYGLWSYTMRRIDKYYDDQIRNYGADRAIVFPSRAPAPDLSIEPLQEALESSARRPAPPWRGRPVIAPKEPEAPFPVSTHSREELLEFDGPKAQATDVEDSRWTLLDMSGEPRRVVRPELELRRREIARPAAQEPQEPAEEPDWFNQLELK